MHHWSQGAGGAGQALQLECPEKEVQEVAALALKSGRWQYSPENLGAPRSLLSGGGLACELEV